MIQIGFEAFDCKGYENQGVKKTVVAIVGPIRIVDGVSREGTDKQTIYNGCSNFQSCQSPICGYSSVMREESRRMKQEGRNDRTGDAARD